MNPPLHNPSPPAGLKKYPRTRHVEGSRLQPGDEDLEAVPLSALLGSHLVLEEKMDGANAALSFSDDGELLLQSRGHYLVGGARERHFDLFKQWAHAHRRRLYDSIGRRYVVYGEWLYAKHTMYYDDLPHYFMEFDVLDRETGVFLDTGCRRVLLQDTPLVAVRVLWEGELRRPEQLTGQVGPSGFIRAGHLARLRAECLTRGVDPERTLRETDPGELMEGLYIKIERDGAVTGRLKYIRPGFLTAVLNSESHWLSRPIVPNGLRAGVDLFADEV